MYSDNGEGAGRPLSAALFASLTATTAQPLQIRWPDWFSEFTEVDANGKESVPLWSPATFRDGRRAAANVETLSALVLDYDGDFNPADIMAMWVEYEHVLHSTFTPGSYRVVIPYDRPVTPDEHRAIWLWAKARDARIDGSCKDASRIYFLPTCRSDLDAAPEYGYQNQERMAVDRLPVDLRPGAAVRSPSSPSTPRALPAVHTGTGTAHGGSAYAGIESSDQRYDFALIEERCAFAAHARADAATLPEPEWYAMLGIVAKCRGGDELAHALSAPYPGYNRWETEAKYLRAKQVGPPRCEHVRTISAACATCPLSISTPVVLGRNEAADPATDADPEEAVREAREVYARARADEDTARVGLDRAKRALRAVRAPRSGASEDDIERAVRIASAAEDDLRGAERIRAAADKALKRAQARVSMVGLPPGANPAVWSRLAMGKEKPNPTVANCMLILGEDPKWSTRLAYDSFSLEVCLDREPLAEERATEITAQLGYEYGIEVSTTMVMECVRAVARRRTFHPVRDWLATLKWDGTSRLRDMVFRGFGASPDVRDPELLVLMVERFLLSVLARVFTPGAKVDTMLVLVGAQGAKKSTALEAVVGEQWFGATKLDLANKDSFLQLRGKLLYEIGEMEGIKKADANVSKHWLSSRIDTYRAPYARRAEDHPRQTVMTGSTNENEILLDPTGFRRYWIVQVLSADVAWIATHRDQLWAEALALREAGRQWWFDEASDETERLRIHTLPYQQIHPWTETIYEWVLSRKDESPFSAGTVLKAALGQMVTNLTQSEATIVGTILKHHIGCTAERVQDGGRRPTMYRRPAWMAKKAQNGKVIQMA
jgi:hypothetical protein